MEQPTVGRQDYTGRLAVYASVGPRIDHYEVDVAGLALARRGSVTLPAKVQYAWPHATRHFLYAASSNGGPRLVGDKHYVHAFRIDPVNGALQPHGAALALPSRPVHITTDVASEHVLTAYTNDVGLTVHNLNRDGTLGVEVRHPAPLDVGVFAHQVRVPPSNRMALLVTRGNDAAGDKPEDPGALKIFGYENGVLTNRASIAPGRGYGFGPRHLDFHPSGPWVYVSLERQNKLYVFKLDGDTLAAEPLFRKETLIDTVRVNPRQLVGTLHVHPNGRFVYVANRAYATTDVGGKPVFSGGENNMAVFAIDQRTGEPTLVQNIDTRGLYARTFAIDPSGRMLVIAHVLQLTVRDGAGFSIVPANLSVFRIGDDGKLAFVRKYDVDVGSDAMFWMGMVNLP